MSNFADKLSAAVGKPKPQTGSSGASTTRRLGSRRVDDPKRAGRAPYNFVPLPDRARWLENNEWAVDQSVYHADRLSGELEIEIEALTDFFVRGLTSPKDYDSNADDKSRSHQQEPYQVNGRPAIPGSSIRGMVRNLIEIVGRAPLGPVNDSLLFFRAVGSTSNPGDRNSFEPHAVAYKSRIDPIRLPHNVKAGFLHGHRDDDQWTIQPAQTGPDGRQIYQTKSWDSWKKPRPIWFRPGKTPKEALISEGESPGFEAGWLICSGPIPKKKRQWVIRGRNNNAKPVMIPKRDVEAYKESGSSKAITEHGFEYTAHAQGVPCFYVEWSLPGSSEKHVTFGHTYNMRVPYEHSVADAIPEACRPDPQKWDLAQAMFGRTNVGDFAGARGRVFFEDALFSKGPTETLATTPVTVILGQPKPTTYQHYLTQPRTDVVNSIHWDGNYRGEVSGEAAPTVRGHKGYFHRPGAPLPLISGKEQLEDRSNVTTTFRPAKKGCVLSTRIRFENLTEREFGALLTVLDLPAGCAHRIGMAKPLGLGSIGLTLRSITRIDRRERYGRIFAFDGSSLQSGASLFGTEDLDRARRSFAQWILNREGANSTDLWADPRMVELKAILTVDGLPADWASRTRYLEFGETEDGLQYNEYKHVGYPKRTERGRPFSEQRRPLPPASQVLTDSSLPNDPRPPFVAKSKARGDSRPSGGPRPGNKAFKKRC